MRGLYDREGVQGEGDIPLFPRTGVETGHRGHHGGQAAHNARLEQLPGPHRRAGGRCRGGGCAGRVRHGLLRLEILERHAPPASRARARARGFRTHGRRRDILDGLPVEPRHYQRSRRPRRLRRLRPREPRQHLRRLPPLLRQDAALPPRKHGRPGGQAPRRAGVRGLPHRHGRRVLHGRRHRKAAGDLRAGVEVRRARHGGRRPRPRRHRRGRPRHGQPLRAGGQGGRHHGDFLKVAGEPRRLHGGVRDGLRLCAAQFAALHLLCIYPALGLRGGARGAPPPAGTSRAAATSA